MSTDLSERLYDLPPSAKLVLKVLGEEGALTQSELAARTLLPQRTVRQALGSLEDAGVVEEEIDFMDARRKVYTAAIDGHWPMSRES